MTKEEKHAMYRKKRTVIYALILVACIVICFLAVLLSHGRRSTDTITEIISSYSWNVSLDELDEILFTDGRLTEDSCAVIDSAMDEYVAGSVESLRLALYAVMRTKAGYPEETARRKLSEQIAAIDVTAYYDTSTIKTLLQNAPWVIEQLFEKYREADGSYASSVLKMIAENSSARSLEDRLKWAMSIRNTYLSGTDFFSASLTEADLPALRTIITELTDPEEVKLCAQGLANQPNRLDEIVPVLYHISQQGRSLGELFPQGIRLNTDLSGLNLLQGIPEGDDPLQAESKFLIISRTEVGVKEEALKEQPKAGYSCHNKANPLSFDVRLETVLMDQMRPEQLPASYTDCQWLAVLDSQYIYGGCITKLKDFATGQEEQDENFYPVYGLLCRLMLVDPVELVPRHLISSVSADAITDQVVSRWTNTSVGSSVSTYRVVPSQDPAWKSEALRQLLRE